ncbi:MAG: (2Fe-2S)-binding protein [Chlorobi bacterium]|nr:(2Fe-2S)-binding protein [Chlorobiota bacterium]
MRVPGISLWAAVTAAILFFLLKAVGVPPAVAGAFAGLWYLIGAGAAYAILKFHHPNFGRKIDYPTGAALAAGVPAGFVSVSFANLNRTVYVPKGGNLRDAARAQGVPVYYDINEYANCFGTGHCGTCRFRPDSKNPGALSEPTWQERFTLGDDVGKLRLACQTNVYSDCVVDNSVAEEFGKVRHYSLVNGALVGAFSLLMLGVIIWIGGDMIGLF